jgi:hypothetical protein
MAARVNSQPQVVATFFASFDGRKVGELMCSGIRGATLYVVTRECSMMHLSTGRSDVFLVRYAAAS